MSKLGRAPCLPVPKAFLLSSIGSDPHVGCEMLRSFTACTHILRRSSSGYRVVRKILPESACPLGFSRSNPGGMPMRRATSNDLPQNAKLPTQADARKQKSRWGVWEYYKYNLKAYPVLTKGLTCFFGKDLQ
jgi:hypothetical protein